MMTELADDMLAAELLQCLSFGRYTHTCMHRVIWGSSTCLFSVKWQDSVGHEVRGRPYLGCRCVLKVCYDLLGTEGLSVSWRLSASQRIHYRYRGSTVSLRRSKSGVGCSAGDSCLCAPWFPLTGCSV